jgi:hypothetical protein
MMAASPPILSNKRPDTAKTVVAAIPETPAHSPSDRHPKKKGSLLHQQPLYALDRYAESSDTDGGEDVTVQHYDNSVMEVSSTVAAAMPSMPRKSMEKDRKSPPVSKFTVEKALLQRISPSPSSPTETPSSPLPPAVVTVAGPPTTMATPATVAITISFMLRVFPMLLFFTVYMLRSGNRRHVSSPSIEWGRIMAAMSMILIVFVWSENWELVFPSIVYMIGVEWTDYYDTTTNKTLSTWSKRVQSFIQIAETSTEDSASIVLPSSS